MSIALNCANPTTSHQSVTSLHQVRSKHAVTLPKLTALAQLRCQLISVDLRATFEGVHYWSKGFDLHTVHQHYSFFHHYHILLTVVRRGQFRLKNSFFLLHSLHPMCNSQGPNWLKRYFLLDIVLYVPVDSSRSQEYQYLNSSGPKRLQSARCKICPRTIVGKIW